MMTPEYYEHDMDELRERLKDAEQQLEVLRPGGLYAWKSKHEAAIDAIRALRERCAGWRDAPMVKGHKVEVFTIRKTLNVVICELDGLLSSLSPGAVSGEDLAVDPAAPERAERSNAR